MTKLSVNVNKLALLRNSREKNNPNLVWWGRKILEWGSHGLTVHPRPDGRHVREGDVDQLAALIAEWNVGRPRTAEFNIEGYPSEDYLKTARRIVPSQCTLVPDPPEALTSNAGWDFVQHQGLLRECVAELRGLGIRVSLFLEPSKFSNVQAEALAKVGCDRVELYTEAYADDPTTLKDYVRVANKVSDLGLGINAGHDLTQGNLGALIDAIPAIDEVSIGHALTCEALLDGYETTVKNYLKILANRT